MPGVTPRQTGHNSGELDLHYNYIALDAWTREMKWAGSGDGGDEQRGRSGRDSNVWRRAQHPGSSVVSLVESSVITLAQQRIGLEKTGLFQ